MYNMVFSFQFSAYNLRPYCWKFKWSVRTVRRVRARIPKGLCTLAATRTFRTDLKEWYRLLSINFYLFLIELLKFSQTLYWRIALYTILLSYYFVLLIFLCLSWQSRQIQYCSCQTSVAVCMAFRLSNTRFVLLVCVFTIESASLCICCWYLNTLPSKTHRSGPKASTEQHPSRISF